MNKKLLFGVKTFIENLFDDGYMPEYLEREMRFEGLDPYGNHSYEELKSKGFEYDEIKKIQYYQSRANRRYK